MKLDKYNIYFLQTKYDIHNYSYIKKKKNTINDDYDKLFFNLLNIVKYPELDMFYNRHKEQNIKLNLSNSLDGYKIKQKSLICQKLSYENNIDLPVFDTLVMYFKLNICYVCENVFIRMFYNPNSDVYYILNKDLSIKCVKYEKIQDILENNYEIENIFKPMNSCSYYKVDKLKEIVNKLNINIEEKIKKNDLYEMIIKHLYNMYPLN